MKNLAKFLALGCLGAVLTFGVSTNVKADENPWIFTNSGEFDFNAYCNLIGGSSSGNIGTIDYSSLNLGNTATPSYSNPYFSGNSMTQEQYIQLYTQAHEEMYRAKYGHLPWEV